MALRAATGLLLTALLPVLPGCLTVALWSQYYDEHVLESVRADVLAIRRIPAADGTGPETILIRFERTGANATSPYDWAQRIPAEGCVRIETRDRAYADDLAFLLSLAAREDTTVISATATFPVTLESDTAAGESVQLAVQYRTDGEELRITACRIAGRCRVIPGPGPNAPGPLPVIDGTYPFAVVFNRSTTRSNVVLLSVLTPFTLAVDITGTIILAWLWWESETADDDLGMRGDADASGRHGIFAPSLAPSYSQI